MNVDDARYQVDLEGPALTRSWHNLKETETLRRVQAIIKSFGLAKHEEITIRRTK